MSRVGSGARGRCSSHPVLYSLAESAQHTGQITDHFRSPFSPRGPVIDVRTAFLVLTTLTLGGCRAAEGPIPGDAERPNDVRESDAVMDGTDDDINDGTEVGSDSAVESDILVTCTGVSSESINCPCDKSRDQVCCDYSTNSEHACMAWDQWAVVDDAGCGRNDGRNLPECPWR